MARAAQGSAASNRILAQPFPCSRPRLFPLRRAVRSLTLRSLLMPEQKSLLLEPMLCKWKIDWLLVGPSVLLAISLVGIAYLLLTR